MPTFLKYPLNITSGRIERTDSLKESLDASMKLIVETPLRESIGSPSFGFVFNNPRFEIFNESEGLIHSCTEDALHEKKLSGSSKNMNTFAADLKQAIARYEPRLANVKVAMTYIREEKKIHFNIRADILPDMTEYQYTTSIKAWN